MAVEVAQDVSETAMVSIFGSSVAVAGPVLMPTLTLSTKLVRRGRACRIGRSSMQRVQTVLYNLILHRRIPYTGLVTPAFTFVIRTETSRT